MYELFGTCFLVWSIEIQVGTNCGQMGIGFMLMAWLIIGGGVSGGHYNPAVTIGVLVCDHHMMDDILTALVMMAGQFSGAALGLCMTWACISNTAD